MTPTYRTWSSPWALLGVFPPQKKLDAVGVESVTTELQVMYFVIIHIPQIAKS